MIINQIKSFFNRKNIHYPFCYILQTKKNKSAIFMHDVLNNFEKEINKHSLDKTEIVSVKQGKKLFFRFLKNNHIFREYCKYISLRGKNINSVIKYNFITPFYDIYTNMRPNNAYSKIFIKLERKWIKLLKSINYIE